MKWRFFCAFLSLLAAAAMVGCSLDEPRSVGDNCEAAQFWLDSDEWVVPGVNPDYDFFFENHVCPPQLPYCRKMDGVSFCSSHKETCVAGAHLYDGDCESDSVAHCGSHDNNCMDNDGWYQAVCEAGTCVAIECHDAYTLIGGGCRSADQCCGGYCKNCTLAVNSPLCSVDTCVSECPGAGEINCGGSCINPNTSRTYCGSDQSCKKNICRAEKGEKCINRHCDCPSGYERCADEVCRNVSEITHCGSCDNDCTATEGWLNGICDQGVCRVSACGNGYHLVLGKDGVNHCEADSVEACGELRYKCADLFEHYDALSCVNGSCVVESCAGDYHLMNGICVADVCTNGDAACGNVENIGRLMQCSGGVWNDGESCSTVSCNADNTSCGICKNGAMQCAALMPQICANGEWMDAIVCPAAANGAATCNDGKCGYTCDQTDYPTLCGTTCVNTTNDVNHCGDCDTKCTIDDVLNAQEVTCAESQCVPSKCIDGFHLSGNSCVIDECISGMTKCRNNSDGIGQVQTCSGGVWSDPVSCSVLSCDPNNGGCGSCKNGDQQCSGLTPQTCTDGSWVNHANDCEAALNGSATCDKGICGYRCDDANYPTLCGSVCVNTTNDTNYCGGCDAKCTTENVSYSSKVACSQSTCVATACSDGYHLSDNRCVEDECTHGAKSCIGTTPRNCMNGVWVNGTACSAPANAAATCSGGDCGYQCESNYCDVSGACVNNDASHCFDAGCGACRVPEGGGAAANCNGGKCGYVCNSGYTDNGARCCANVANGTITHNSSTSCSYECINGYHKDGSGCAKDVCSGTETSCRNDGTTGKTKTCSGGVWGGESACKNNYSCNSTNTGCGSCVNNTKQCSGNTPQTCTNGSWTNGTCTAPANGSVACNAGDCVYTCDKGYHLNGTKCEKSYLCAQSDYVFYTLPEGGEVLAYCLKSSSQIHALGTASYRGETYPEDNTANAYVLSGNYVYTAWVDTIGSESHPFTGIFAGETGNKLTISSASSGIFGYVENAKIFDLNIETTIDKGDSSFGGLVDVSKNSTIKGINISVIISKGENNVGGLIGTDTGSIIENVKVQSDSIFSTGSNIGGLIGNSSDSSIKNNTVSVAGINYPSDEYKGEYVGGIVGNAKNSTFEYTKYTGTVKASRYLGGFVGQMNGGTVSDCVSNATVIGNSYTGGFVGSAASSAIFSKCAAFGGRVDAWGKPGGFVGYSDYTNKFSSCFTAIKVTAADNAGGFVGTDSVVTVSNCYSFNITTCAYSDCYCFSENVSFITTNDMDTAYYYADGCKSNVNVIDHVMPIEMNGSAMTKPNIGGIMECTLESGTFKLSIPDSIHGLVSDICH